GIDTGDVLELLVKEGDIVAKDQGIIELETGKATLQVPSSAAGKVAKVHVKPGQSIPPGTLLLTLEGAAAAPASSPPKPAQAEAKKETASKKPEPAKSVPQNPAPEPQAPAAHESAPVPPAPKHTPAAAVDISPAPSPEPQAPLPQSTHDGGGVAAGPAVRRFA